MTRRDPITQAVQHEARNARRDVEDEQLGMVEAEQAHGVGERRAFVGGTRTPGHLARPPTDVLDRPAEPADRGGEVRPLLIDPGNRLRIHLPSPFTGASTVSPGCDGNRVAASSARADDVGRGRRAGRGRTTGTPSVPYS